MDAYKAPCGATGKGQEGLLGQIGLSQRLEYLILQRPKRADPIGNVTMNNSRGRNAKPPYYTAADLAEFRRRLGLPRDNLLQPHKEDVKTAMADVAVVLKAMEKSGFQGDAYTPAGNSDPGSLSLRSDVLCSALLDRGHAGPLAGWAIYRLIKSGLLGAEVATIRHPVFIPRSKGVPQAILRRAANAKARSRLAESIETIRECEKNSSTVQHADCASEEDSHLIELQQLYLVIWPTNELLDWWKHKFEIEPGETLRDGPHSPDEFVFNGISNLGLEGKPFKLVSALWTAPKRTLDRTDLARPVWGDKELDVSNGQINSSRTRCNNFFEKKGLPFRVEVSGTLVSLVDRHG